jgi:hypothetical protein
MTRDATIIAFPNPPRFSLVGAADPVEPEELELGDLGEEITFTPAGPIVEEMLDKLDRLRRLITDGRIQGLIFVGQDPVTGYFLTETCLDRAMNRSELFGYMGVLETLKMEIGESAAVAPVIDLSGTIIDPYEEEE